MEIEVRKELEGFSIGPHGRREWLNWIWNVLRLRKCWSCRWNWIWRRDTFFELDGECHACWLWSK
ncbi:hypothetical protein LCGC14_1531150 [marine sediment metagenome]|uniref:Uncharacterized protein n=1 Tax=marine sediment metagenome TaxID=412755 RepID=A0A0F9IVT2_9ZZZZ